MKTSAYESLLRFIREDKKKCEEVKKTKKSYSDYNIKINSKICFTRCQKDMNDDYRIKFKDIDSVIFVFDFIKIHFKQTFATTLCYDIEKSTNFIYFDNVDDIDKVIERISDTVESGKIDYSNKKVSFMISFNV